MPFIYIIYVIYVIYNLAKYMSLTIISDKLDDQIQNCGDWRIIPCKAIKRQSR